VNACRDMQPGLAEGVTLGHFNDEVRRDATGTVIQDEAYRVAETMMPFSR
jgi:hypothetical protein